MPTSKDPTLDSLAVLNAAPDNFLILLPDTPRFTIMGASDAYLKATYTRREEVLHRGLFEVFPDNPELDKATGVSNLSASLHTVLATKRPHRMADQRYDVTNPQTGAFELKVWSPLNQPVLDASGEVSYIIHTVTDITEKVLLEEAARTSRESSEYQQQLLYSLFLQAPVAIAISKGPQHIIELANNAMLKIWGRTAGEVMGKPVFESLPQAAGQGLEQIMEQVLHSRQPFYANEFPVDVQRNGKQEQLYFNFVYEPLKDLTGTVSGTIVVASEVTEQVVARKKVEENEVELRRINEDLKHTNEDLEQFAYAASHDLKEPARKTRFFIERLKTSLGAQLNPDQRHLFDRMEVAAVRMWNLIEDLLLFSFVTRGATFVAGVKLDEKVAQVLDDLELEIQKKGARIVVDPLPAVRAHRRQIHQLFLNLICNALHFSKPGVAPEIRITCTTVKGSDTALHLNEEEKDQDFYRICIQDNGIGFEPEDAERIFQVFTRLHVKKEVNGTGLGLAIVRKIVDNHQGHIWAEGEPGHGATFYLLLPVH